MNERDLFLAAIEIASPTARTAYLDQACAGNAKLRAQVEELLRNHADTSRFLETPAVTDDPVVDQTLLNVSLDTDDESATERASGAAVFRKYLQPATRPDSLGRLGHYEIEEILGRGAFGIVAKAFDKKLHRVVAIKLMSPELASTSPPRQRFLREARTAAAVMHENIVAIHDVEEEPIPYLVMEYISGQTLQQRMDAKGPLKVTEVLQIGQQVAAGLAAAHGAKLIHRDIKPSNILLTDGPNLRAKISDFGLARAVDDSSLTQSGLIAGTPMYMAPEQARGETLDHRVDLFSLGSVLYQMVGGRPPFRAANTVAVLKRVCEDTPRPLVDVLPGVPGWLETIIFKLLEKDRDDRYQTAQEVAELLARCRHELEHNGKVTCAEEPPDTQDYLPKFPAGTEVKKNRFGWLAGGVLAVGVMIGLTLMNGTKEKPEPDVTQTLEKATSIPTTGTREAPTIQPGSGDFPLELLTSSDWEWTKPENLGPAVNTAGPEASPHFSTDRKRLWFQRGIDSTTDWACIAARETPDKPWNPAQSIGSAIEFSGPMADLFLSRDEQTWMFVTWGPQSYSQQVFESTRPSPMANWSEPKLVAAASSPALFPVLSDDGLTLYITNARDGDSLYALTRRTTTESWSEPQRLPIPPNFAHGGVRAVWNSLDGRVLVFHTVRGTSGSATQYDLWLTTRSSTAEPWQEPISFGPTINTTENERGACLSDDGRELIFASDRPGGLGDTDLYVSRRVRKSNTEGLRPTARWPADAPPPAIAPFDSAQAKKHQEEWAAYLKVPVEHTNSIGMQFVLIPPGEFTMGSTPETIAAILKDFDPNDIHWQQCIKSEAPQHKVILTQPMYLGVTEVTQTEYEKVMGTNPSNFSPLGMGQEAVAGLETADHPVERVSWNDAAEFCARLSVQEKMNPFYSRSGEIVTMLDGTGYRLPSEAEWEFACSAGTATKYWFGNKDEDMEDAGWFGGISERRTHPVGQLKANPFGLNDIHGNVWEWVQDGWDATFYGQSQERPAINPSSPFTTNSERVVRGGNWYYPASTCRSSERFASAPTILDGAFGFRASLTVDAVKADIANRASMPPADAPAPAIAPFGVDKGVGVDQRGEKGT